MSWAVVHFLEENSVEVIPETWTVGEVEAFWPSIKNRNKIFEAIRKRDSPGSGWGIFKIRKLGCYDDFKRAQQKCNKARDVDNLSSCTEEEPLGKGFRTTTVSKVFDDFTTDISDESEDAEFPEVPKSLQTRATTNRDKANHDKEIRNPLVIPGPQPVTNNTQYAINIENETHKAITTLASRFEEFQKQIFRDTIIIKTRLKDLSDMVNVICKERNGVADNIVQQNQNGQLLLKKLPLQNIDDIENIETVLLEEDNFESLAKELSLIGGDSVKEITNRILFHVFSNSLGAKYSWEGLKGKKIFKNLKLAALIIKSIRLNGKTHDATEADIIKIVKSWLVRCKGRETREKDQKDVVNDDVPVPPDQHHIN